MLNIKDKKSLLRDVKMFIAKLKRKWERKHWNVNSPNFEKKLHEAMKFYLLAAKLKYRIRTGWDDKHWNIKGDPERIAEHVYGAALLAISLDSEFDLKIDLGKVLKMIAIHEIGEVKIGDITPFDNITPEEKEAMEHKAMSDMLGDLCQKEELLDLLFEFDEHKTKEANFAYLCDKIEADIQAKVYQDQGRQHDLSDQKDNVVFNNPRAQKMVKSGAKTAFDIWYLWDKNKFEDSPLFKKVLEYTKDNNTNI
jgi:putative hydrolase of HD superfamily